jgi:predicted O-methyltransferase YrrM
MKTGSGILKGLLLRRIVAGTGAKRVLELGTNTGFSGSYFLSVNNLKLTTVEGSSALCQIADRNMSRISDNYQIHNCLFDEAIDRLTMENEKFDCVFLDGQHEREATLHYAKRLKPLMSEGAIYIFDDIYWSDDMNQAWKDLTLLEGFSHSVDFLTLGVLRQHTLSPRARPHDLGNFIPRPPIFRKGW